MSEGQREKVATIQRKRSEFELKELEVRVYVWFIRSFAFTCVCRSIGWDCRRLVCVPRSVSGRVVHPPRLSFFHLVPARREPQLNPPIGCITRSPQEQARREQEEELKVPDSVV